MGKPPPNRRSELPVPTEGPGEVRIIGGRLRGTVLAYDGDPRVRPMKDRVREAVFNLLGNEPKGMHVIDLFGGTGALAVEAMSRGAAGATLFERHFPTARHIDDALKRLQLQDTCRVLAGDAFYWVRRLLGPEAAADGLPDRSRPWLVFVSPPYQLYYEKRDELKSMLAELLRAAPVGSRIVVESDERFDLDELPRADEWQVRHYPPAVIAIFRLDETSTVV